MEASIPWIEKYRPTNFDDLVLDEDILKQLEIFMKNKPGVHLIITGCPGIGKTSTVKCIAKKILGNNLYEGYLELNAAEDRCIKSISLTIPPFCKKMVNFDCSKIILLDEADNVTPKCQCDINEMIKLYGHKTKFIFTCNQSDKISDEIQSVCHIIRFKKMNDTQIKKYLGNICQKENIPFDNGGLSIICYIADGDMRKAINDLQKTAFTFGKITKKNVLTICKVPDPEKIKHILELVIQQDLTGATNAMDSIIREGYCLLDIVSTFSFVVIHHSMDNQTKLKLMETISQTKIAISVGIRTKIQLSSMLCKLIKRYRKYQS